jgi:hypothetical protein
MSSMRTQIFSDNYGYGKLLLKTHDTSSTWGISTLNTNTPCQYTVIDNADNSVVHQGIFTSADNTLTADLSLTSGDCSVYIDVDDNGNDITRMVNLKSVYEYYLDVIPNLKILYNRAYNNTDVRLVSGNLNKIEYFEIQTGQLKAFDFSNNILLKTFITRYGMSSDIPIILSQCKNLRSLWAFSDISLQNVDTNGMNELRTFKSYGNQLNNFNLDNASNITQMIIRSITSGFNLISTISKPTLDIFQLWNAKSVPNVDLSLYPNLTNAYIRNTDLATINIDNPLLERLYLSYNTLVELVIPNTTNNIKYLWISYNSNLTTLTKPALPKLLYANIGGYTKIQEFDFSDSPLLTTVICNHGDFKKMNLKNGNTNAISIVHTYYKDCCFLVDTGTDTSGWTLRSGDVITDNQDVYDAF